MKIIRVGKKIDSAAFVVKNKKGEVLVLKRSKESENNPDKWNLPGGGLKKGETYKEGAIRECQEEAGITPKNVKFLGNYGDMAVYIGESDKKPKINEESSKWKYISKKDIGKLDFVEKTVKVLNKVFN